MKPAALLLVGVLLGAIGTAFADDPVPAPVTTPASAAPAPSALGGLYPMPDNTAVPLQWMPPGSFDKDRGPSTAVFPPQKLTIRFNHKLHVGKEKLRCETCHTKALTSQLASDALLPPPTTCDGCHGTSHGNLDEVLAGDDAAGKCEFCHLGYQPGDGNKVARVSIPPPNMVFNHQKHAARNIKCQQCHGDVQELELATRDSLPRMRGCFGCHQHPDAAARGDAKSSCETCHLKGGAAEGGRLKTVFASGTMNPPRWMHNAQHAPDFIERHKMVAANDSQFCANCHKEDFCVACHDGRVRPRNIHPADYISMHPIEARLATQRCTSCHREQSFCLSCHQRLGVSMSGPAGVREPGRFHPPKNEWSDAPRRPGHHAFEAMRNLNACVSCHVERDCVICHGGAGIGGGFNPHSAGFAGSCAAQMRRNPRPCLVCHEPGAAVLQRCQ
ncbi:MAG: cytochrome c family protein [Labilithrix sp.]|nr:cytochrome c family protein [Labilithrix sp.]MCW5815911.1 cytochrome c family protein [Labilithrix sp.]